MKTTSLVTFTTALWMLLFVAAGSAQVQQRKTQQPERPADLITIDTDLVVTSAQITKRSDGSPVRGLGLDDFLLREEGKNQRISLVREDQPLSVVMLIDGMACLWPAELEFQRAREALDQLGDDAEIALMAWDSDVVLVQPFTMDRNLITSRLEDRACFFHALNGPQKVVRPERDWYRPGEAIHKAAAYLETTALPLRRKIILTLVTSYGPPTLMAETHRLSAAEVEGMLEKSGATVYALYLTERRVNGPMPLFGRFMPTARRRRSGGTLEKFVEQTGGSVIVGKREAPDEWLIKLAGLIRTSYSIGYYPDDKDFDGRFRHIKLELSRSGKTKAGTVNIKMRNGYRALRPSSPVVSEKNLER